MATLRATNGWKWNIIGLGSAFCTEAGRFLIEGVMRMGMYCEVSVASSEDDAQVSAEPMSSSGDLSENAAAATRVSLEKAWHGMHYLLTGEVWDGQGPLAFLLAGGKQVGGSDESPRRWFAPDETMQIHQALSDLSDDQFWSRFDADEMEQQQIYPVIWDEPEDDLKQEYTMYFHTLKQVVANAANSRRGLLVTIG